MAAAATRPWTLVDQLMSMKQNRPADWMYNCWDDNGKWTQCRTGMLLFQRDLEFVAYAHWLLDDMIELAEYYGIKELAIKPLLKILFMDMDRAENGIHPISSVSF
jgi:hypothetical protein